MHKMLRHSEDEEECPNQMCHKVQLFFSLTYVKEMEHPTVGRRWLPWQEDDKP